MVKIFTKLRKIFEITKFLANYLIVDRGFVAYLFTHLSANLFCFSISFNFCASLYIFANYLRKKLT
jgi:hypothetical protein